LGISCKESKIAMKPLEILEQCPTCRVPIGENHDPGCSVERCPFCGRQMIQDNCCYEYFGIAVVMMEVTHPDIYKNGLTDEMVEKWEEFVSPHLLPWTGIWPGVLECREYHLWCRRTEDGWVPCVSDHPDAIEDLNTLAQVSRWDKDEKKYVIRVWL